MRSFCAAPAQPENRVGGSVVLDDKDSSDPGRSGVWRVTDIQLLGRLGPRAARGGWSRSGAATDIAVRLKPGGSRPAPASESVNRQRSILALHASWIAAKRTDAVIYVCVRRAGAERVLRHGEQAEQGV